MHIKRVVNKTTNTRTVTEFIQSKDKFFTWQKFTEIDNKEKYWTFLIEQREFGHYWSFNVISSAKRNMPVM